MNIFPDKIFFEQAAAEMSIDPALVEKDWYVAQVLSFLSTFNVSGFQLVFSGGTSLSKAYGLIKRFSEDIDFKIVAKEPNPTRSKLSNFKHLLISALEQAGFRIIPESLFARDGNRFFSFHIEYNSHFAPHSGLRPHIQLEFTFGHPALDPLNLSVSSFINQLSKKKPETEHIKCVSAVETAADKISALVWRISKQQLPEKPENRSLVRHIHDLAVLENLIKNDVDFPILVLAALESDNERNTEIPCLPNERKFEALINTLEHGDKKYRTEYETFVNGLSYASTGETPDYDAAISALHRIIADVLHSL